MGQNSDTNAEKDLRCARRFLVGYNICMIIFGMGCMAVGIWLNAEKNVHSYLAILVRYPGERAVTGTTVMLICAGILLIAMAIFCCYALRKQNSNWLLLYALGSIFIMILLITAGFILIVFREQIPLYVKDGMRAEIQGHYTHDNYVGLQWNRAQMMQRCCGVDGSWDYYRSNWWYSQNPGAETVLDATIQVPDTCCKLAYNEDRDTWWVDPQNCHPKDKTKCNQDAQGRRDGSDYLNPVGCFAAITGFILTYFTIITVMGLVIGFIQIIGIFVSYTTAMQMKHMNVEVIQSPSQVPLRMNN